MKEPTKEFFIRTNKPVGELCGNTVWLIKGVLPEGERKKSFFLSRVFIATSVRGLIDEDFRNEARGTDEDGVHFPEPIALDDLPWFNGFKKNLANFSIGLTDITDMEEHYVSKLEELSKPWGWPRPSSYHPKIT